MDICSKQQSVTGVSLSALPERDEVCSVEGRSNWAAADGTATIIGFEKRFSELGLLRPNWNDDDRHVYRVSDLSDRLVGKSAVAQQIRECGDVRRIESVDADDQPNAPNARATVRRAASWFDGCSIKFEAKHSHLRRSRELPKLHGELVPI